MQFKLTVDAGDHDRENCPVAACIELPKGSRAASATLTDTATGDQTPCQAERFDNYLYLSWILDQLPAGKKQSYLAKLQTKKSGARKTDVKLTKVAKDRIKVEAGGKLLTNYWSGGKWARPFLHPVMGPTGKSVTRYYPMRKGVPHEAEDHPHHKGIFVAWGNVEGTDNWSESKYGHGRVLPVSIEMMESGPVYGHLRVSNDWVSRIGQKEMEEIRDMMFYNLPQRKLVMIDLQVTFLASQHNVHFLDTKEGGICGVRVAGTMKVSEGLGGRIENSFGGINQDETWGKPAQWCDYSGPVDGEIVGISVFDYPTNPNHPTYWHVRDYGLMTANPFGASYFTDKREDGSYLLRCGDAATFSYRIYVHKGRAGEAQVGARYHDYINPPTVTVRKAK